MLGERICLLRRRQGWSQAELARHLRVSPSAVGMYEQGRREPPLAGIVEMSRVFGVSADYLLTGQPLTAGDEQAMEEAVRQSAAGFGQRHKGLSPQEQEILLAALMGEA